MKDQTLELSLLFDFYGDLLTRKQRELFDLYHNEDLSLAEIAEYAGITRQAVRDGVKRAEHTLHGMEERLHLVARSGRIRQVKAALMQLAAQLAARSEHTLDRVAVDEIVAQLRAQLDLLEG